MMSETATISTKLVPQRSRLRFLPNHFSGAMLHIENRIYNYAGGAIPGYNGGFWEFVECSNGAGYLRLQSDAPDEPSIAWAGVVGPGDEVLALPFGNPRIVSPDAAGLMLTILAVSHTLRGNGSALDDKLGAEWEKLMEVVYQHRESDAIRVILD